MAKVNHKLIYGLIGAINKANGNDELTKERLCCDYSIGRTQSLRELTQLEYNALEKWLETNAPGNVKPAINQQHDKQRKAIIAIFRSMGKTVDDAKAWAESNGCDGVKKRFNEYNGQELYKLIRAAENIKQSHDKKVNRIV
jgi:hypothetical protein